MVNFVENFSVKGKNCQTFTTLVTSWYIGGKSENYNFLSIRQSESFWMACPYDTDTEELKLHNTVGILVS